MSRNRLMMILVPVILLSLTSCRFGNRIEQRQTGDPITGYYDMAVESVDYCVTTGSGGKICKEVPANQIPDEPTLIFSDPVILILKDINTGDASFYNKVYNQYSLPTKLLADNKIGVVSTLSPKILWADPGCLSTTTYQQDGSFTPTTGQTSSDGLKLAGTIELKFSRSDAIQGDCASTLQLLSDCYSDMTKCGNSSMTQNQIDQETIQSFFNPYIQSGAMSAGDITDLTGFGYEVTYQ